MNILIVGGAGFIGSHLSERLVLEGHTVICFDNFSGSSNANFKYKNIDSLLKSSKFYLVNGDIQNYDSIGFPFYQHKIDAVYHLAAQTGVRPSVQNPEYHYKVNVLGTLHLLKACVANGVKKIIFASSSAVYGNNPNIPFSEEDTTSFPLSPYASSKTAGEHLMYVFHKMHNIDIACLRPFTVYGPRQRKDMAISRFTRQIFNGETITIFGDGQNSRDYTFVEDIVTGFVGALDINHGYEIYNIGCSNPTTLSTLINLIETRLVMKATIEYSPMQVGEAVQTYADITKARIAFGYSPKVMIKEGIDRYIDWYLREELGNAI